MSGRWAAFTKAGTGRVMMLCNKATISNANGDGREYMVLWDTGCTKTSVSDAVIRDLSLVPEGESVLNTAAGPHVVKDYTVTLSLANKVEITDWEVSRFDNSGQPFDVIVGMDVIGLGEFAISFKDGITSFSFRIPAQGHADFTGEADFGRLSVE